MLEDFGGAATIERFIDGPEYTILVAENPHDENDPLVFTPMQYHFLNGHTFKHFDLKWSTNCSSVKYVPVTDQKLAQHLKEVECLTKWTILIKSIRELPKFRENDQNLRDQHRPVGFDGFIKLIVKAALKRKEKSTPRYKIEYDTEKGFHLVAARDITVGEKIYSDEVATLTSAKYVRDHWTEQGDSVRAS
uniref:Uncharacterized protein n=1 Tax=Romanomermis culicivorax TaxID=13658 RepID=A0A915HLM1_ROMCU